MYVDWPREQIQISDRPIVEATEFFCGVVRWAAWAKTVFRSVPWLLCSLDHQGESQFTNGHWNSLILLCTKSLQGFSIKFWFYSVFALTQPLIISCLQMWKVRLAVTQVIQPRLNPGIQTPETTLSGAVSYQSNISSTVDQWSPGNCFNEPAFLRWRKRPYRR